MGNQYKLEPIYINYVRGEIYRLKENGDFVKLGYKDRDGYLRFSITKNKINKTMGVHRFIYEKYHNIELTPNQILDHINRKRDDNRIDNLRLVSNTQNNQNSYKRPKTSSIYKGVHFNTKSKKWHSTIRVNGKKIYLGCFDSEIESAKAYNKFVKENNMTYIHIPLYQQNL